MKFHIFAIFANVAAFDPHPAVGVFLSTDCE